MWKGRMVAKGLFAGTCFVSMSAACNPNGCAPTDNPTLGNLTFLGEPGARTILSEDTIPTVPHDAWGAGVFSPGGRNIGLGLYPGGALQQNPTIDILYQSAPPPARLFREEVNVFARDPAEYTNTIFGIVADVSAWDTNTGPCALPQSVSLFYPTLSGQPTDVQNTTTETYFPSCDGSILPKIAGATGHGSILGALMNDHGVCGAVLDVSSIFPKLQSTIFTQFSQTIQSAGQNCADAEQQYFYASEYILENPNLAPDIRPTGGFDLNWSVDVPIVAVTGPRAAVNFSYEWTLGSPPPGAAASPVSIDGILTVDATEQQGFASSDTNRSPPLLYHLEQSFSTAVPQGIDAATIASQAVDLFAPKSQHPAKDCVPDTDLPTVAGATGVYPIPVASLKTTASDLNSFIQAGLIPGVQAAASDGTYAALGLNPKTRNLARTAKFPNGALPSDILAAPFAEPDPANATYLHNWVCALVCPPDAANGCTTDSGGHYRYEYVVRARRLNFYPDSVELIWSDDVVNEVGPLTSVTTTNSAVSLYVFLYDAYRTATGDAVGGALANLDLLCNGIPAIKSRQFAVYSVGDVKNSYSNVGECIANQLGNDLLPWNIVSTITGLQADLSGLFGNL